jgi:RNA polymerase sigma-70 factor, ECF subfamily
MITDEVLMLQFQAGSREAFDHLFERYRDPVYAFFRRRLWSKGPAEDLAQETWIAVLKGSARYEPRAQFRSYLFGIAFKLLANERRKLARDKIALSDIAAASSDAREPDYFIRDAVEKLEAIDREVLMLREYEQLSYGEIAEMLRIPANTVRSRLFRARLALKDLLEAKTDSIAAWGRS